MNKSKRKISILIPIQFKGDDTLEIFLQRRSADMKVLPNHFGFWGGGAEDGETPLEALQREAREELGVEIHGDDVQLFNHYEFLRSIKDVYTFEAREGWDKGLVIGEGDYGQWFALDEALKREDIILEDKVVLNDLGRQLLQKSIQ